MTWVAESAWRPACLDFPAVREEKLAPAEWLAAAALSAELPALPAIEPAAFRAAAVAPHSDLSKVRFRVAAIPPHSLSSESASRPQEPGTPGSDPPRFRPRPGEADLAAA